ncbi:peptidyl-alpha-hydroxyglycine alpha-amidating lyase family protein [Chloroflexota bacterium]
MLYGTGKFTYELVNGWAKYPESWGILGAPGLTVDSQDRLYVFSRGTHPITVFDREGNLLTSWGEEGLFKRAHGIYAGPDGSIYCTDDTNHTVRKFTPDGKPLLTLGKEDQPSDTGYKKLGRLADNAMTVTHAGAPFNRPTGVALSSSGEIYVSDGYGNCRVHKFASDGTLLFSWGEPGDGPGQFRCPHSVLVDTQERVWIADRVNKRAQVFDTWGKFINQIPANGDASVVWIDHEETVYICGHNGVSISTVDGQLLAHIDDQDTGKHPGLFVGHAMVVDSKGDIYIGQPIKGNPQRFDQTDPKIRVLQKWARKK